MDEVSKARQENITEAHFLAKCASCGLCCAHVLQMLTKPL